MRFFYLDASALAKRYAPEAGSPLVNHLLALVSLDRLHVFNVSIGEIVSVLVRKHNAGHLTAAELSQALLEVGGELVHAANLNQVVADKSLMTASLPLIVIHAINATDAIILRSALDIASSYRTAGDDLVLVASDKRLLTAAQAEGLITFNPETQSQADLDALI